MPMTLLHITYDPIRRAAKDVGEDIFNITLGSLSRPIEETRAIVHRMLGAGDYWAVAEFEDTDLEYVWRAAQNGTISLSWSRQPPKGVRPLGDGTVSGGYGYRSSMVGDVVVIDGNCHVVANVGFQDLGPLPDGVTLETLPRPKDTGAAARKPRLPEISGVDFVSDTMVVTLRDERTLQIPLERFPRLAGASEARRKGYEVEPLGIYWPWLDFVLSTKDLIRASEEADLSPPTVRP